MANLFAAVKYINKPWYETVPFSWVKEEEAGKLFVRYPSYCKTDVKRYYQDRVKCREPQEDWLREEVQLLKTCSKFHNRSNIFTLIMFHVLLAEWVDAIAKCKKAEKYGRRGELQTEEDDGRLRRVTTVKHTHLSSSEEDIVGDDTSEEANVSSPSDDSGDCRRQQPVKRKRKYGEV